MDLSMQTCIQGNHVEQMPPIEQDTHSESDTMSHALDIDEKFRVLYLACLQTLVKLQPKAFHGDWKDMLLQDTPTSQGRVAKYTLTDAVACDPSSRVRHGAAAAISTLIEGPGQRAYLGIGEVRANITSFVSLSESLGRMIIANIDVLNRCILSETDELTCCSTIRALTTFLVGCSWNKMPHAPFWRSIETVHRRLIQSKNMTSSTNEVRQTCLASLAALFGLRIGLTGEETGDSLQDSSSNCHVCDTLLYCIQYGKASAQLEATVALRGMVHLNLLKQGSIDALVSNVVYHVKPKIQSDRHIFDRKGIVERSTQQMILLLGDMMHQLVTDAVIHSICRDILTPAASHAAPKIRASGYTAIAQLPVSYWQQDAVHAKECIMLTLTTDTESTARSSAMKAYSSMIKSTFMTSPYNKIPNRDVWREMSTTIQTGLDDTILAVRIPSATVLETVTQNLWQSTLENLSLWKNYLSEILDMCATLDDLALKASEDHEKVKVQGIHALGYLTGTRIRITPHTTSEVDPLHQSFEAILKTGIASKSLSTQWAVCDACKVIFLTSSVTQTQTVTSTNMQSLLQCLMHAHQTIENSRTRAIIEEVLQSAE